MNGRGSGNGNAADGLFSEHRSQPWRDDRRPIRQRGLDPPDIRTAPSDFAGTPQHGYSFRRNQPRRNSPRPQSADWPHSSDTRQRFSPPHGDYHASAPRDVEFPPQRGDFGRKGFTSRGDWRGASHRGAAQSDPYQTPHFRGAGTRSTSDWTRIDDVHHARCGPFEDMNEQPSRNGRTGVGDSREGSGRGHPEHFARRSQQNTGFETRRRYHDDPRPSMQGGRQASGRSEAPYSAPNSLTELRSGYHATNLRPLPRERGYHAARGDPTALGHEGSNRSLGSVFWDRERPPRTFRGGIDDELRRGVTRRWNWN